MLKILTAIANPWPQPAWIITTPRSGSTWLCKCLNAAAGLPLNANPLFPEQANRNIWCEQCQRGTHPGHSTVSKVMVEQIAQWNLTPPPAQMGEERGESGEPAAARCPPLSTNRKLIHLERRDEAAQAASMYCAAGRNKCHATSKSEADVLSRQPIEWNEAAGHHYMGRLRLEKHTLITEWVKPNVMTVIYEDLLQDPDGIVSEIMRFLGVTDFCLNTTELRTGCFRIGSPPEILDQMRRLLLMHNSGNYSSGEPEAALRSQLSALDLETA